MGLNVQTINWTDAKNVWFTHQDSNHIIGVKQDWWEDFLCSATKNQYCSGNELLLSFKKPFTDINEVKSLFEFTRNYLEWKIPNNYTASLRGSDWSIISDFSQLIWKSSFIEISIR